MLPWKNIAFGLGGFISAIYVWQLIARNGHWEVTPARFIEWTANITGSIYNWIGIKLAWISSFYTLVNLSEAIGAFHDLASPTVKLIVSPFKIFEGYFVTALSYKYPILIVGGSLTLVGLIIWVILRYGRVKFPSFGSPIEPAPRDILSPDGRRPRSSKPNRHE